MNDLLQQASAALSRHDAGTLERLAVEAQGYRSRITKEDMAATVRMLQVLHLQVSVAACHLALRQRLSGAAAMEAQRWAH